MLFSGIALLALVVASFGLLQVLTQAGFWRRG